MQNLADASTVLPASYSGTDVGRATKGAAYALLVKVQLHLKNYQAAQTAAAQVAGYSLISDYYNMFRIAGENGSESIFEI